MVKLSARIGVSRQLNVLLGIALICFSAVFSLVAYGVNANGAATIEVSPTKGPPGATVSVSGHGFTQIVGTNVTLTLTTSPVPSWHVFLENGTTLADGSFSTTFMVPAITFDNYTVVATDEYGVNASADFEIGFVISPFPRVMNIIPISGSVGTNVTLTGWGFPLGTYNVTFGSERVIEDGVIVGGFIDSWFIVPTVDPGIYDVTVEDSEGGTIVKTFSVHSLPSGTAIVVYPTYGAPGATISVSGYGFTPILGTGVTLNLTTTPPMILGTTTTLADGSFSTTFMTPLEPFQIYQVVATDDYGLSDSANFKIGIIAMIISPTSGPVGTDVALTGVGFFPGPYNATFGSVPVITNGVVSVSETISDNFFVPSVAPGTYDVTVKDSNENELSASFMVTPSLTIPEFPLGTISAIAAGLIALLIAGRRPHFILRK
jgi:hypothetical protein